MKFTTFQRRAILGGVLVATVAAALAPGEEETAPAPAARTARPGRETSAARSGVSGEALPQLKLDLLAQPASRESVRDAFEERSWAPPPPKPAPPPPPVAPPLPFKYMGKIMDGATIVVFLVRQDSNFTVRAGDKIGGNYQVEEIRPGAMTFNYLPLGQKQTLAIGAAN